MTKTGKTTQRMRKSIVLLVFLYRFVIRALNSGIFTSDATHPFRLKIN